jgi:hypothetical protein
MIPIWKCNFFPQMRGSFIPQLKRKNNNHYPKSPLAPDFDRISFDKFFAELWRLADALSREPERFFVVQATSLESGDGVVQVRFQFAPVVGREIGLRGEFVPPVFNGGVQIETGLIFHNLHREL